MAKFYQLRQSYKTNVCDSISNDLIGKNAFNSIKGALDVDFFAAALVSNNMLTDMQHHFAQCMQMMDITIEEIEAYRREREIMDKGLSEEEYGQNESMNSQLEQLQDEINKAKEKLNLE